MDSYSESMDQLFIRKEDNKQFLANSIKKKVNLKCFNLN